MSIAAITLDSTTIAVIVVTVLALIGAAVAAIYEFRKAAPARNAQPIAVPGPSGDLELPPSGLLAALEPMLLVVLAGYAFFDRAFAYIHIPGTPLFISEIVIAFGVFALLGSRTGLSAAWRESAPFRILAAYMAWGGILLILGLPTWGLDAVRDSALWYYGIVAVFVVSLLLTDPNRIGSWLRLFGRATPWMLAWFPVAVVLDAAFIDSFPSVPDSEISIVSHRTGNIAVMAGMALAFLWLIDSDEELFDRRQRAVLTGLGTVVILFAGLRNRGGFVAAAVALFVAFLFMRRSRSNLTAIMVGVAVVLLSIGLVADVRMELFGEREVSVQQFVDNLVSVVDRSAGGARQQSTTEWRLEIWGRVLDDVTALHPVTGFGPGPDLGDRYEITGDGELPLRNPHNSHVGVLARMGFVGAILWAALWLAWLAELLGLRRRLTAEGRTREASVAAWLIVSATAILVNAIFDPTLEGPQVGWWLWALFGAGVGIAVLERFGKLPALSSAARPVEARAP